MFFSDQVGIEMTLFSPWHLLQVFITAIVIFFIYKYRNQLRDYKHEKRVRYIIGFTLLFLELTNHIWYIANGKWELLHNLPLELCTINIWLSIVLIFTKNRKLFGVIYFWGFGALLSVIFPDMSYGPDRYRYYQFFYAHMMFFWIYMYMIFVHDFKPQVKEFLRSCVYLFILAIIIVLPINLLINENYMFVLRGTGTPLEIIEPLGQFLYTTLTVIIIFFVALIWYLPIFFYLKKTNKLEKWNKRN